MVPGQLSGPSDEPVDGAPVSQPKPTSREGQWRRRSNAPRMPADEAMRQGDITHLAFRLLGKDRAIAFLNSEHVALGGRPIALATQSKAGNETVRAELEKFAQSSADAR
jgi:hypothetical protein